MYTRMIKYLKQIFTIVPHITADGAEFYLFVRSSIKTIMRGLPAHSLCLYFAINATFMKHYDKCKNIIVVFCRRR